jgi:hypothetical protein
MACKGSGVQIPSAPPQVRGPLRLASRPIRRRRAADLQQTLNETLSELPPRRPPGYFCRSAATRARPSRLIDHQGDTGQHRWCVSDRPAHGLRAEARSRWPPEWPISGRAGSVPASSDSPWPPDPSSTFAMSATTLLPAAAVGASNRTPGASLSSGRNWDERRAGWWWPSGTCFDWEALASPGLVMRRYGLCGMGDWRRGDRVDRVRGGLNTSRAHVKP